MLTVLLFAVPALTGLFSFFVTGEKNAKGLALFSAVVTLVISLISLRAGSSLTSADISWLPMLGSRFTVGLDGIGRTLTLLNAVCFPLIFAATYNNKYRNPGSFYGLMLLTQAGLMGVFISMDLLLFYFFWELALIPAYFLCSKWGGEKRVAVTFKFFIYTFIGSLLMLVGILYVYYKGAGASFSVSALHHLSLTAGEQYFAFWLFFIAFAIKMPIFPLHTWQPDTYEQSPTAVTMVLSGIMVKMGVFAVMRWLIPLFPVATEKMSSLIIILSVIGMLYASLIAIRQDDLKRLVAYSSIAHIGLMAAAMFSGTSAGMQGVIFQMFAHGVNIIGLWIVIDLIEQQLGTRKLSELGGLAQKAPTLAILFVVMALANIALPLTNAFIGEFLMFSGVFAHSAFVGGAAGISIILAAVYTLWMVQKVFYGEVSAAVSGGVVVPGGTKLALIILTLVIVIFGIYPQPMFSLSSDTITKVVAQLK